MPNGGFWQKIAYAIGMLLVGALLYEVRLTRQDLTREISGMTIQVTAMRERMASWSVTILDAQRRIGALEAEVGRGVLPLAEQQLKRLGTLHEPHNPHVRRSDR